MPMPPAAIAATAAAAAAVAAVLALGPLAAAAPAPAQEEEQQQQQQWRRPGIECRCRAGGRTYAMGERACLRTPAGFRLAECSMVQNVASWTVLGGEGCVVSALPPPAAPGG